MWQYFLDTQSWASIGDNTRKAGGKCRSWETRFRWVYDNGTMNDIMWNLRHNWNWRTRWKNSVSKQIRMVLSLTSILLEIWLRSRLYMMMMVVKIFSLNWHSKLKIALKAVKWNVQFFFFRKTWQSSNAGNMALVLTTLISRSLIGWDTILLRLLDTIL